MSKLVSPRSSRQATDGPLKKGKSSKLLAWGRKAKEGGSNTKSQNAGTPPLSASPKPDPPAASPHSRGSILLGKDTFVAPTNALPKKNPDPIPNRLSKEERLSIIAPNMATTSRHNQEISSYWKNSGAQRRMSLSQSDFPQRGDNGFVPPHSKRPRGTVSRPLPPATPPPSSIPPPTKNEGALKPLENSRDASPQARTTSIYGVQFNERRIDDTGSGEAEPPPIFMPKSSSENPTANRQRAPLEKSLTLLIDELQEEASRYTQLLTSAIEISTYLKNARKDPRRLSELERNVTFQIEDDDVPIHFSVSDLERDLTFNADTQFSPQEHGLLTSEVTFTTEFGEDGFSGIEREITFSDNSVFADDSNSFSSQDETDSESSTEEIPAQRSRFGLNRELTLGGLKNLAVDLNLDMDESSGSQDDSYSTTESEEEDSDAQDSNEEIPVGPGAEVILRYKVGRGATATVWCGMVDSHVVAIKQITLRSYKEGVDSAKVIVKKEYDIIRSVSHPSIIRYHGLFYDKEAEEVNIVMQMITGVLITELVLYMEAVPEDMSSFLLQQIIGGFCHLHNVSHVIHRDLKPDNVLVDTRGRIKIIDFGTATSFDPSKEAKRRSTVGTPWYCAPEILNDEEYTTTCDVWSLGCFTLELVTGKPPFDHLNATSCLFQMSQESPPIPKTVSEDCSSFLHCCLNVDWSMRPSMQKLQQHPFITNQPNKPLVKTSLCQLIKEMLAVKEEKDKFKAIENPTQIADDRLTFTFGPTSS